MSRAYQLTRCICNIIYLLAFGITNVVLSQQMAACDNTDLMGLNVSQYLLGLGILNLISVFCNFLMIIAILRDSQICQLIMLIIVVFGGLVYFSWFIIGAIILFRSNISCIQHGIPMIIYALVMWCLIALQSFSCSVDPKNVDEV
jgi:hypothetical protein